MIFDKSERKRKQKRFDSVQLMAAKTKIAFNLVHQSNYTDVFKTSYSQGEKKEI